MKTKNRSLEVYHTQVLLEVRHEALEAHGRLRSLKLVNFESKSNGKGRRHRRRREVTLLVDTSAGTAYQVVRGEIRPQRSKRAIAPDVLANEALSHLPVDERTTDHLLQRVKQRTLKLGK